MANSKKKWVAFRTNAIIPAEIAGAGRDKKVQAKTPVLLPAAYADHVVHDKFAEFCKPPAKPPKKSEETQSGKKTEEQLETAKTEVAQAKVDLQAVAGTDGEPQAQLKLDQAVTKLKALETDS